LASESKSILSERLRKSREAKGLTQQELSRLCGFGITQISRFETGLREPTTDAMRKIARTLGVSMDYLAGLVDIPHGQFQPPEIDVYEQQLLDMYRNEGWAGVIRLGAERLSK